MNQNQNISEFLWDYRTAQSERENVKAVCFSLEKQKSLDPSQNKEKSSVISNTLLTKATQVKLTTFLTL